MKLLTNTISTLILTLVLSAFVFAASDKNPAGENFLSAAHNNAAFNTNFREIPHFVLDTNFRWWQPPQPVPTVPSYERMDVAWTNGQVIFYNPHLSSQVPLKVAAFILAHEYGHIYWRTSDENASDAFAARVYAQTDKSVCQAAVWWMIYRPNGGDWTHPPSPVRAQNIARECGL